MITSTRGMWGANPSEQINAPNVKFPVDKWPLRSKFLLKLDWALRASAAGNYDLKRKTITIWVPALQPAQTAGSRGHAEERKGSN